MGNQFFHIGEEKAENGVDVADAFRRLAEELRGNPNGQEARQKALTLLRRKDINGVLGETRVEWLRKDISQLQDTESIQTFLVNSSRYMEKEGIAKLSWENLSKYLGQLDQPAQEADEENALSGTSKDGTRYVVKYDRDWEEWQVVAYVNGKRNDDRTYHTHGKRPEDKQDAIGTFKGLVGQKDEGDFSKASSPIINDPKDKRKQSELAKDMPDSVKLKDSRPQDIESHWTEMDDRQRTRVAKEAGFNEVESRELAKLAWEGLDPSIKKDLSWVLNADPEHLPGKDDVGDVGESDNTDAEAQEDLDNVIRKEMDDVVRSFAEARASESWSTATDGMREDYGDGVHVTAEFGEWLAVNGALIMPGKDIPQPPAGFKKTKFGGAIPDFEVEVQMENVKDFLARELKFPLEMVERVAQQQKFGTSVMVKVSGKSEVFALQDNPVLTESVEDFQKGGWSQDRVDSVWHKKVGTKSGAAFPAHMDAYGKFFWSVYDGSNLVARGEERTDKEAMQAADEHLQPEALPVGEAAGAAQDAAHAEFERELEKAADTLIGDETSHEARYGDARIDVTLRSVDTRGTLKKHSDGDFVAEPKLVFDVHPKADQDAPDDFEWYGSFEDSIQEEWKDKFKKVVKPVMEKFFPDMEYHVSVGLRPKANEGWLSIEFWNKGKYESGKTEADEPNVTVRPMTLDPKTKRQANAFLAELSKKYWPSVPLFDIAEELKKYGLAFEDSIVTGAQGRDTFELSKGGMPIKNSMLAISWFKMPVSGKYEITAYLS